ncbi:hypothetical protein [Compostibacter hankyongensis]|uniref:Uncharacterized protein n=1 Tax=Compostibacter hankyongensis TaxID=1007089 RepID=A0ABP8FPP9_9BACT
MVEFNINFNYDAADHMAVVLKSVTADRTDYIVRPVDPELVLRFGKQVIIFKEHDNYNCGSHVDETFMDFVDALANAIRRQDRYEA